MQCTVEKQALERQVPTALFAHPHADLQGTQGVAAQGKKVVLAPDSRDVQHLGPDTRQPLFQSGNA